MIDDQVESGCLSRYRSAKRKTATVVARYARRRRPQHVRVSQGAVSIWIVT